MTPGAWKRHGITYKLAGEAERNAMASRRSQMDRLRTALWHFAAKHNGKFPSRFDDTVSPDLWEVPESGGMVFFYCSGLSVEQANSLLAYEPELEVDERLALLTSGEIVTLPTSEIKRRLGRENKP
jgi:hypothetical protein